MQVTTPPALTCRSGDDTERRCQPHTGARAPREAPQAAAEHPGPRSQSPVGVPAQVLGAGRPPGAPDPALAVPGVPQAHRRRPLQVRGSPLVPPRITVAGGTRMVGRLLRVPGLRHTLVALRRALAARACLRLARRPGVVEGGKLVLEVGQLKDCPAVFIPSMTTYQL